MEHNVKMLSRLAWKRAKVVGFSLFLMLFFYACTLQVEVGIHTYILSVPALVMILLTAYAEAHDIHTSQTGAKWDTRRNGILLIAMFAAAQLLSPLISVEPWPSWKVVTGTWGFALIWVTDRPRSWVNYVFRFMDQAPHSSPKDTLH